MISRTVELHCHWEHFFHLFLRCRFPTNSVDPLFFIKTKLNPQFIDSLWRGANARNASFQYLYGGPFILSTQLINPNFCVSRPHQRSTTVSLETNPLFIKSDLKILLVKVTLVLKLLKTFANWVNSNAYYAYFFKIHYRAPSSSNQLLQISHNATMSWLLYEHSLIFF